MASRTGIYSIMNKINHKTYYGSSYHCEHRMREHKNDLCKNKHSNAHLQNAWNKYGETAFTFKIEEEIPKEQLLEIEQRYLDVFTQIPELCYNMAKRAEASFSGRKHTDETFIGTKYEFRQKYHVCSTDICRLIRGEYKTLKGWTYGK